MTDALVVTQDGLLGFLDFLEWGAEQLEHRAPDHPDLRRIDCDNEHFQGVLVDLGKLWLGVPLALGTAVHLRRYSNREWQHLDDGDRALHGYALDLAHCFPLPLRGIEN